MRWLTSMHLRYWPIVLIVILIASGLSVPSTTKLFKTISTDPIDLLPKSNPNVTTLKRVRAKLERGVRSSIVLESNDRKANVDFLKDIASKLEQLPFIAQVDWKKPGYDFFDQHKLLYLEKKDLETIRDRIDKKIQKEKLGGFYIDLSEGDEDDFSFKDLEKKYASKQGKQTTTPYNESPDGKIFSLGIESTPGDTGLATASHFQDELEGFVKTLAPQKFHPTMKVYLMGPTKVVEYRTLMSDLTKVGIISLFLIFLPLLIRFRNPLHVLTIFLPLIVGMPISFALSSLVVPKLNLCTSFLFAILGGLGIENGIHIFSRYYEDRKNEIPLKASIENIYKKTGRAILTSVASVAITFLAISWTDFRGFSEFGIISGIGLIVIFLVYFAFMPSLIMAFEHFKILKLHTEEPTKIVKSNVLKFQFKWILVIGIAFTIFSICVAPFLSFEYDAKATRAEIPSIIAIRAKQRKTVTRVNNPAVAVIENKDESDQLHKEIDKIVSNDKLTPTIDTARSYYDLFPEEQSDKIKIIHQIKKLLDDKTIRLLKGDTKKNIDKFRTAVAETSLVTDASIPTTLRHAFKGNTNTTGELFYINAIPSLELDDGLNAIRFADDVSKISTPSHTYYPSSDAIVYGLVLKTMLKDAPGVLLISVLSIFFFVFLDFRKLLPTVIVVTPIILGVIWMLGMMWIADIRLNFFNIIIVPAVLGMSIDNSIHIFHRYKELGPGSLSRVLSSSGLAALLASLTNASAFVGLLFCTHKGLLSIGELALVGVGTCLLSTLVFFPALLEFFEKIRFNRKRPLQ